MRLVDMHCDTIMLLMQENVSLGSSHLCIDLDKMKAAGSMAQFFACFINLRDFPEEERLIQSYEHALKMIAHGKKNFVEFKDQIALIRSFDDLVENDKNGKMSAVLTIEEGGIIYDDMSRLERLYEEGVRLITLTWNYENCMGYPNSRDSRVMERGLKPFGIEAVKRMNELGIIVDVSHLSDGGFWDVLKHSNQPVVASHSNARTVCAHPRNLTDEMIRALAEKGGVSGLNFCPFFLAVNGKATAEHIADHIEHMYQVGGEDFVAMGTDFDGFTTGEIDVLHMGQMDYVYNTVKKRGFTERQMEKIWSENALRVIKEVLH